jgi:hypothetical protein
MTIYDINIQVKNDDGSIKNFQCNNLDEASEIIESLKKHDEKKSNLEKAIIDFEKSENDLFGLNKNERSCKKNINYYESDFEYETESEYEPESDTEDSDNNYLVKNKKLPYDDPNDKHKIEFNEIIVKVAKIYMSNNIRQIGHLNALILDGKDMKTTNHLTEYGLRHRNITSIEKREDVHNIHIKNGINSINKDFEIFVNKSKNLLIPFDMIILDINKTLPKIKKLIEKMINKNFLSEKTLFTFSTVPRSHIKGNTFNKVSEQFVNFLEKIRITKGFRAHKIHEDQVYNGYKRAKIISQFYLFEK